VYNEPLNIENNVKLFLNFISDGSGIIQIEETQGFDALNFVLQQESKRYGRDVIFGDTELTFYKTTNFEAFEKLIEFDKIYGFESEVQFIVQVDGINFVHGELEFQDVVTDGKTTFTIKVLQNSNEAKIKRKKDIKIDLFASDDLEGNAISPVQTHNILLKAKPVTQVSKWLKTDFSIYTGVSFSLNGLFQNPLRNIQTYGVEDTLTPLESFTEANNDQMSNSDVFKILDAQNDLVNNQITFEDIKIKYQVPNGEPFENIGSWLLGEVEIEFLVYIGLEPAPNVFSAGFELDFTYEYTGTFNNNIGLIDEYLVTITNVTYNLPVIGRNIGLWGVFNMGRIFTTMEWVSGSLTITSTANGIDSVITAVRLNDAQKQVVKSINGNPVNAPDFESIGTHYNNFIFSGKLARQRTDEPFQIAFKDIENHLQELNYDYQSNENEVDMLYYGDYYSNEEAIAWGNIPFEDFEITYNERYLLNEFSYKYKSYEQDKDEKNTIDAVHTETQYLIPNNKVQNKKDVQIDFIRDPFKIEFLRVRNTQSDGTTSLNGDDETFILDCIELAPNTTRTITALFIHNIDENENVQLLNDGTFNWTLLGFNVGAEFEISAGLNIGNYIVDSITFNIVTLTPISFTPNLTGESLTTVNYLINNVQYTNRTNEGFTNIQGIENPNEYSNLIYTIRRNIELWKPYLSTAMLYNQRDISNTLFVNNPNLITTKTGDNPIIEKSNIEKVNLNNAILSPKKLNTTITGVSFYDFQTILNEIRINKKFIRVADTNNRLLKVHPINLSFSWKYNTLEIEAEIRLESEFVEINNLGNIIEVNQTGYEKNRIYPFELVTNDNFIQIFDNNFVPLINKTRYDFVKINGLTYNSIDELAIAMEQL